MTNEPGRWRHARRAAAGLILAVVLLVLLLPSGCANGLFYRPDDHEYATPAGLGLAGVESLEFAAEDGPALHGWWIPAVGAWRGTVVYCHGNHANLTLHARHVRWLPEHGFAVLLFDYRGYGRSEGSPDRAGTVADTVAAIDLALARDPQRTVLFGHSLGGAVGIVAAAQRPAVRAVVAESTFPSYRAAARGVAPWLTPLVPLMISDGLDPEDHVAALSPRPVLVIHGIHDRIVPLELGEALYRAAAEPKDLHLARASGHRTPWYREGAAFEGRVAGFFREALARRR